MNIFKKALIVALSIGLISIPSAAKEVEAANISTGDVLYLNAGGTTYWEQGGAKFSAYFFNSSTNKNAWATEFSKKDSKNKYYKFTAPNGTWTNVIFVRNTSAATSPSWTMWNQTGDLKYDGTKNLFNINSSKIAWEKNINGWSSTIYYEFSLSLYDGDNLYSAVDLRAGNYTATLPILANTENHEFLGWSKEKGASTATYTTSYSSVFTSNDTLYAVWKEKPADNIDLTYVFGDYSETVSVKRGSTIEESIPKNINDYKLKVLAWDKTGVVNENTEITATKYYTTFDEVKTELAFSYGYRTGLVVFQCPIGYEDGLPKVVAKNKTTNDSVELEMKWVKDENNKKEFYANVNPIYNELTFNWKNNGVNCTYTCDRDYTENAVWWDNETNYGKFKYDIGKEDINVEKFISSVSNMKLRVGTLLLKENAFGGVSSYGIRIAKEETIADDNYYGPKWDADKMEKLDSDGNKSETGGYIRWNAVINDIPYENYNDVFTAVAYVEIDGVKYDLCKQRTFSVLSIAKSYTTSDKLENGSTEKNACQYIVDKYSK